MPFRVRTPGNLIFLSIVCLLLTACPGRGGSGGGGGGEVITYTSFELIDPIPASNNNFGTSVVILNNGNVVVVEPGDDSNGLDSGAVHLYNSQAQILIASIFGDVAGDQLGSGGITALANSNFVIASPVDDEDDGLGGFIVDAGSVRLVSGTTGTQIGSTHAGDVMGDQLGYISANVSGITALANNNFVIASQFDDEGGVTSSGSVRLVNGGTGAQIGSTFAGDVPGDLVGYVNDNVSGITALGNSNFVIVSPLEEVGNLNEGSVRLVNGGTGAQIGSTFAGDERNDQLGYVSNFVSGITVLGNNNFVIASALDDDIIGGNTDAGSVRLVDGSSGVQLGNALVGDEPNDQLGYISDFVSGITVLGNNNFVIVSALDDDINGSFFDHGSVRLVDGSSGAQIGNALVGDGRNDQLGYVSDFVSGITVLGNNNFVIVSALDDVGGAANAGSVMLVNGIDGMQIGTTLAGDVTGDLLGYVSDNVSGITALANNNFVIASQFDDVGAFANAGSVRLVNGSTGAEIDMIVGDVANDKLGYVNVNVSGITALANNNFVIASALDDEDDGFGVFIVDAGSVRLVDGGTGMEIDMIAGDVDGDQLGYVNANVSGITALANNNFVIASALDDNIIGGIVDVGSVRLVDGSIGAQIDMIVGDEANDQLGYVNANVSGITALGNSNFVIASALDDNIIGGIIDAGSVRLVDGSTGLQIGTELAGDVAADQLGYVNANVSGITALANNNFVVISPNDDEGVTVDAGTVRLVDGVSGLELDTIAGNAAGDVTSASITESTAGSFYILALPNLDHIGGVDSGLVSLIAE